MHNHDRTHRLPERIVAGFGTHGELEDAGRERLLAEVRERARVSGRPGPDRLRIALPIAAAVIVVAVIAGLWLPNPRRADPGDVAFALVPLSQSERVLHYVIETSEWREETWVDYERDLMRTESISGDQRSVYVTRDGESLGYETDGVYSLISRSDALSVAEGLGFGALRYREGLTGGRATALGDGTVEGIATRRLRIEDTGPEGAGVIEVVDVRASDGLPVRIEQQLLALDSRGEPVLEDSQVIEFDVMELVTYDPALFELDLPAGVPVREMRSIDAEEAATFEPVDLVWLGESFEGLPWEGVFSYEHDASSVDEYGRQYQRATATYANWSDTPPLVLQIDVEPARPESEWVLWTGNARYEWRTLAGRRTMVVFYGTDVIAVTQIGDSTVAVTGPRELALKAAEQLRPFGE